jgi:hypothetical protein
MSCNRTEHTDVQVVVSRDSPLARSAGLFLVTFLAKTTVQAIRLGKSTRKFRQYAHSQPAKRRDQASDSVLEF